MNTLANRPLRVLVVEDHKDLLECFALVLRSSGHEVRTALDGSAALRVAEEFVPDVAFIDIGLPGLDGYELAGRLRQRPDWGATVYVALSGYGRDEDRRRSQETGFDHHLTKPVEPREILQLLTELATAYNRNSGPRRH